MRDTCDLCGPLGLALDAQQTISGYWVCDECLDRLVENKIERNGGAYDEIQGDSQSGDDKLAHQMSEARKVK